MTSALRRIRSWSGTARRLAYAFGSLILTFAIASWFSLSGLRQIHDGLQQIRDREEGVILALQLASAVRDQYAHQAHTIIIGDESHMGFYSQSQAHVIDLTREVRRRASSPEEQAWADEIEQASKELDSIFRESIVPAVLAGERMHVYFEHDRGLHVVGRIQERVDLLVDRFESSIREFEARSRQVAHNTYRWTVGALLSMVLLAAGIGLYIGRSIAVPLSRLSEGAARLARGEMDARIAIDTPDEFGDLARQFNAMTAALEENQRRLVQSEKLAGIGRLAAGVAHEINNPLGVILGYTRLLVKKADPGLAADLKVIEDETLRSKEIVEGLLDLSRPLRAMTQPADLREMCEGVVERLRETGQLQDVSIAVEGDAEVVGAAQKLRQVLFNLVKNAVEAAGPGGRVAIRITPDESGAQVAIADTGPGLSPEAQARLFEPFFTTKASGTGLGLAVSRAIARAHGGDIEAGPAPGGGALFTLKLPRRQQEKC